LLGCHGCLRVWPRVIVNCVHYCVHIVAWNE
jgi:hypothetical protein